MDRRSWSRVARTSLVITLLAACSTGSSRVAGSSSGKLQVVAAENVWGSVAAQLGGHHVEVQSLISNPDTDPHDYEPTPGDARALASAKIVIVNGIGYDTWADKLVAANPVSGRVVVNVGKVVGLKAGANPHQWYAADSVDQVIGAI